MNETIITDGLGSVRTEAAPRRTITAYKLMRLVDGKLYPLYIDRSEPVQLGVWYNADSVSKTTLESLDFGYHLIDLRSEQVIESRQRKPSLDQVKRATAHNWRWFYVVQQKTKIGYKNVGIAESNGEETVKADFALRPGWHCGSLPVMNQIGKGPNRNLRDDSFVWTEIEISADIDYNDEAKANGGELYYIPHSGYYEKCTNANKAAAQADKMSWYIAGAIKINRIISDSEAQQIIDRYNREHRTNIKYDYPRESGKMFNADTMSLQGIDEGQLAIYHQIKNLQPIEVVDNDYNKDETEDIYRQISFATNENDNNRVFFPFRSLGKILRHKGFNQKTIIPYLTDIFTKSIPFLTEDEIHKEGHKEHPNFKGYKHYIGKISFNGNIYYVRFTIQMLKTAPGKQYATDFSDKQFHSTFVSDVRVYENNIGNTSITTSGYYRTMEDIPEYVDTKVKEFLEKAKEIEEKQKNGEFLSGTISPDQLALFGDVPQPKQSHYGLLFDETDAKWNLTAEDIALIDELQKQYNTSIPSNEPERNRRNAQLAYCLIKFLKGEADTATKNALKDFHTTEKAYINPEYARYYKIAEYLYRNPITRFIVRKYVPEIKGNGSIKKMFDCFIELYKQQKNAKTDDANWFDAEELKRRLAEDDGKTGEKLLEIAAKQAGIPTAEPAPTADEPQNASDTYRFAEELAKLYADGEKFDFGKAKTINRQKGYNFTTNQLMQACELAVVIRATQIAQGHEIMTLKERYDQLVDLYGRQVTIQPKDSRASSLQQYSTPAPLAFLLGCFVDNWLRPNATRNYFEPTAGNGLLTIALDHSLTTVNELDDVRFHNLQQIGYQHCYNEDICNPSKEAYMLNIKNEYAGVIMNPPFDKLDKNDFLTRKATIEGREATYTFERLDHKIAILSLEKMRDDGRAAIIIGGKMAVKLGDWKESYWKNGAIFGQYRTFITYLNRQYNIVDVLYINGDLYRKQGTTFPIVAILIDGRTEWNGSREHQWHKFDELRDNQIDTFNELYLRLEKFAVNPDREANVANYRRLYEPQKADTPDRKRAQALLMLAKAKIKIAQAQQTQRMKQ